MTGSKLHLFRNTKLSFASAKTACLNNSGDEWLVGVSFKWNEILCEE